MSDTLCTKLKITGYLVLLTLLTALSAAQAQVKPRIINGSPGYTATYPWMASVTVGTPDGFSEGSCGGALIAPNWVLTAGHCFLDDAGMTVDTSAAGRTSVLLNSDTISPAAAGSFNVMAKQVIVHPNYNPDGSINLNSNDFDVALVELETPVNLPTIALASGQGTPIADGAETIIMGWGTTGVDADGQSINASNILLQAKQQIIPSSQCELVQSDISTNMVCAGAIEPGGTTDTCQGDSGGPMVVSTTSGLVQVGIVSYGGVCGTPDEPGVYARVSQFNDFIGQYVTKAVFKPVTPLQFNCTNSGVDNLYNLTLPCLSANGQTFGVQLSLVDQNNWLWQWNGLLGASACGTSNAVCSTLGNDLSLTVPGLSIGGTAYTAILSYSDTYSNNGKIIWQFQGLYEE